MKVEGKEGIQLQDEDDEHDDHPRNKKRAKKIEICKNGIHL